MYYLNNTTGEKYENIWELIAECGCRNCKSCAHCPITYRMFEDGVDVHNTPYKLYDCIYSCDNRDIPEYIRANAGRVAKLFGYDTAID